MESAEVRLRLVEALARNNGASAINNPDAFLASVAKIETFVLGSRPTQAREPDKPPKAPK